MVVLGCVLVMGIVFAVVLCVVAAIVLGHFLEAAIAVQEHCDAVDLNSKTDVVKNILFKIANVNNVYNATSR